MNNFTKDDMRTAFEQARCNKHIFEDWFEFNYSHLKKENRFSYESVNTNTYLDKEPLVRPELPKDRPNTTSNNRYEIPTRDTNTNPLRDTTNYIP